ncbi:MAG: (4Fe-4S)-binding protein [Acidobacteria bacterium]|nr:MAG: (4Fe-4S)-binding protein [Acidobacteriota bacterium]
MSESEKTYSNGEITIIWKPGICIHSGKCVQGLREVFNVSARPWINIGGASTDRISKQVEQCPSGALSYVRNKKTTNAAG